MESDIKKLWVGEREKKGVKILIDMQTNGMEKFA